MAKGRHNQKKRPQKPSIKIPSSPSTASKNASAIQPDNSSTPGDLHSGAPSPAPFETPPTSPPTAAAELLPMDATELKELEPPLSETQDGTSDQPQSSAEGQPQDPPEKPLENQEQTHPGAGANEDLPAPPENPGEQTNPGTEKEKPLETAAEDAQSSDSGQVEILPPGPENISPPIDQENQAELERSGEQLLSESIPEGQELQSPLGDPEQSSTHPNNDAQTLLDDQEHSSALANDNAQPVPDGEDQMKTLLQSGQPEEDKKELPAVPKQDEAQIKPLGQNQEKNSEQHSQRKTPENTQQSGPESSEKPLPPIDASEVASGDILLIANALSTMKTTLISMAKAFDCIDQQSQTMITLSLDLKTEEQIRQAHSALERQIAQQKLAIESLRSTLHDKIKQTVEEKIRNEARNVIRGSLKQQVEERVRNQLAIQIPENLRQQVISHKRQILEVRASLHNSEARRHNSLQTVPGPHARLRPLLRPLPTPEQSPVILISRSSSMEPSSYPTPATAFPQAPAPTPIKRVSSNSLRSAIIPETVPPTPSRLFPRDLTALFALSQEEARTLLREYGLDSATSSPAKENARSRGLSVVNEESSDAIHDEDPDAHARDLNKFMAHIGVPFLMIPAPKEKVNTAPLSSRSRRKLLTPLIIK